MEMEAINDAGKKIGDVIHIMFSKSKLILELRLFVNRGSRAISHLFTQLSCKSNQTRFSYNYHHHNMNTKEYEFSCSNTPTTATTTTNNNNFPASASSLIFHNKNLNHSSRRRHSRLRKKYNQYILDHHDVATANISEDNNHHHHNNDMVVDGSPLVGFGGRSSPSTVRQLRVTDSPFPVKECDMDLETTARVNVAAEEFIDRFYMDLRLQKSSAMFESPYRPGYI